MRPIRSAYDEFMADFTASLIGRDPGPVSNGLLLKARLYDSNSNISESDVRMLRRFDVVIEGTLKESWRDLMKTPHFSYIFFAPSRRPLWLKVEQAFANGVPPYVIYENVFHLLRKNFDALGPELENGFLDPDVTNATLLRDIQNLSF